MGYYMQQTESKFYIRKTKHRKALKAIKRLSAQKNRCAWVEDDDTRKAKTLADALNSWRWEPSTDPKTGDIDSICFNGEKSGADLTLFTTIAPYVEAGSFIAMMGEDAYLWRWYFDGKTVSEQSGEVVYAA